MILNGKCLPWVGALSLLLAACTRPSDDAEPGAGAFAEMGYEVVVAPGAQKHVYSCSDNKQFTLHVLPDTAWVQLPERMVRLPRDTQAAGMRYSNGDIDFSIEGEVARLETEAETFSACRKQ